MTTLYALAVVVFAAALFSLVVWALSAGPDPADPHTDAEAPYRYFPVRRDGGPLPTRPGGLGALKAEIRASAEPANVYDLGLPALVPQRRIPQGVTA